MHGPLRVYRGKNYSRLFWSIMVSVNAFLLIWQNSMLIKQYFAKPTASQVSKYLLLITKTMCLNEISQFWNLGQF